MSSDQMRRQSTGPDHDQDSAVISGQNFRSQAGDAGGSVEGQRRAVHGGEGLAGGGAEEHVTAVNSGQIDGGVLGEVGHELDADVGEGRGGGPGGHEEERRCW